MTTDDPDDSKKLTYGIKEIHSAAPLLELAKNHHARRFFSGDAKMPTIPSPLYRAGGGNVPETLYLQDIIPVLSRYVQHRMDPAWWKGWKNRRLTWAYLTKATGISKACLERYLILDTDQIPHQHFDVILKALGISLMDLIVGPGPEARQSKPRLERRLERAYTRCIQLIQEIDGGRQGGMDTAGYKFRLQGSVTSIIEELEALAVEQKINRIGDGAVPCHMKLRNPRVPKYKL